MANRKKRPNCPKMLLHSMKGWRLMPNAARIRLLDPDELLGGLAASLDALRTGAVDLPEP